MQHPYFQKKNVWPFVSFPRAEDVCKERACARMVLYVPFHSIWYAICLLSEKMLTFWPDRGVGGGEDVCKDSKCTCNLLYAPFTFIWYATWLLSEKKCLALLTPPQCQVCVQGRTRIPRKTKQKSNKANLSNLYLRRRVILDKLINQ